MRERLKLWWRLRRYDLETWWVDYSGDFKEMAHLFKLAWHVLKGQPLVYRAEVYGYIRVGRNGIVDSTTINPGAFTEHPAITIADFRGDN